MTEDTNKKKFTVRKTLFLLGVLIFIGVGVCIVYERFFYVSPSVKESNDLWIKAYGDSASDSGVRNMTDSEQGDMAQEARQKNIENEMEYWKSLEKTNE